MGKRSVYLLFCLGLLATNIASATNLQRVENYDTSQLDGRVHGWKGDEMLFFSDDPNMMSLYSFNNRTTYDLPTSEIFPKLPIFGTTVYSVSESNDGLHYVSTQGNDTGSFLVSSFHGLFHSEGWSGKAIISDDGSIIIFQVTETILYSINETHSKELFFDFSKWAVDESQGRLNRFEFSKDYSMVVANSVYQPESGLENRLVVINMSDQSVVYEQTCSLTKMFNTKNEVMCLDYEGEIYSINLTTLTNNSIGNVPRSFYEKFPDASPPSNYEHDFAISRDDSYWYFQGWTDGPKQHPVSGETIGFIEDLWRQSFEDGSISKVDLGLLAPRSLFMSSDGEKLFVTTDGENHPIVFSTGDDDYDGILNLVDLCQDTSNDTVNHDGCALYQLDSDADGYTDDVDDFPFDPEYHSNEQKDREFVIDIVQAIFIATIPSIFILYPKSNEWLASIVETNFGEEELAGQIRSLRYTQADAPEVLSKHMVGLGYVLLMPVFAAFLTIAFLMQVAVAAGIFLLFVMGVILVFSGFLIGLACMAPLIIFGLIFG